jgi:hypothetical protein
MRRDDISSIQSLLGPLMKLPSIRKPQSSFEDWARFLTDCDEAGLSAVSDKGQFATELGFALYRRWRWLAYAKEFGLSYAAAEAAWDRYSGALPRRRPIVAPEPRQGAENAPQTPTTPVAWVADAHAFFEAAQPVAEEASEESFADLKLL